MSLDLVVEDERWSESFSLEPTVQAALDALARHPDTPRFAAASVCVVLSADAAVRELNRSYRSKDKPTNVLSFPASGGALDEGGRRFLGDIVLARETVLAEAAAEGIEAAHHASHLVVHGVLHLLGFDHETEAEAVRMEALETAILASLGIADPYATPAESAETP